MLQLIGGLVVIAACASEVKQQEASGTFPYSPWAFSVRIAVFSVLPSICAVTAIFYRHIWVWWIAVLESMWFTGYSIAQRFSRTMPVSEHMVITMTCGYNFLLWFETFALVRFFPLGVKIFVKTKDPDSISMRNACCDVLPSL
ncbi:hypothetical protein F5Y15DRAFT_15782 [Xylariaceae sp. FL0016]|nr:hypothetical protein F5Y15DRAFT_15782 [Xylariaceae sp. FL0016]